MSKSGVGGGGGKEGVTLMSPVKSLPEIYFKKHKSVKLFHTDIFLGFDNFEIKVPLSKKHTGKQYPSKGSCLLSKLLKVGIHKV